MFWFEDLHKGGVKESTSANDDHSGVKDDKGKKHYVLPYQNILLNICAARRVGVSTVLGEASTGTGHAGAEEWGHQSKVDD